MSVLTAIFAAARLALRAGVVMALQPTVLMRAR